MDAGPADCIREGRSDSAGRRQPSLLPREEWPSGQGKKVGEAVAGQGRAGVRPAPRRGRKGASPELSPENGWCEHRPGTSNADVAGSFSSQTATAPHARHQHGRAQIGVV